jgi:hypothetical protein
MSLTQQQQQQWWWWRWWRSDFNYENYKCHSKRLDLVLLQLLL